MRKLAVIGAVTAGVLGGGVASYAATTDYDIEGINAGGVENNCTNITLAFNNSDCSWAKTRQPSVPAWSGMATGAAQYAIGSTGDDVAYRQQPGDGKQSTAITGSLTIDDGGTPDDGSDDTIGGTFIIDAAARNVTTGNEDFALERWTSITHTMQATPVTSATPNPGGGFTYLIASKGLPTPKFLRTAANPAQCFPSDDVPGALGAVGWWTGPALGLTRVGVEFSDVFGAPDGLGNKGASTTAVIEGWECVDDIVGDTDCTPPPDPLPPLVCVDDIAGNEGGEDCSTVPTTKPATLLYNNIRGPGFDNILFEIVTDGSGAITSGFGWWNRIYQINAGPAAANTSAENSYSAGLWVFTSPGLDLPTGEDPADPVTSPACENWGQRDVDDTTPDAFSFTAQTDVAQSTLITSNTVTITGIDAPSAVSVTGGEYSVGCNGTFTSAAGTIENNQSVCVRHTSAATASGSVNTNLIIGGVSAIFTSTTSAGGGGGGGGSQIPLPGGGGSFDLLALGALLGALPLVRRRRKH
jgi:hypothetical protein